MKKITFLVLASIAFLGESCQHTPGYKITGIIHGLQDGDTIKLARMENRKEIIMQQTLLKNGRFTFSGRKDTAAICYISYPKDQSDATVGLILENADITLEFTVGTKDIMIKGSPVTEAWMKNYDEILRLYRERDSITRITAHTPEALKERRLAKRKKTKEISQCNLKFCQANIQNPAGVAELIKNYKGFDVDEAVRLISLIPGSYMNTEIAAIQKDLADKQKSWVGRPYSDFAGPAPDGTKLNISDVLKKHKVVMVDFWASWCGGCLSEMSYLKTAYAKYHDRGFEIVGVSLDEKSEEWINCLKEESFPWLQICDLKGWNGEGPKLYGLWSIPANALIVDGKIIARNLRGEEVEEKLATLF